MKIKFRDKIIALVLISVFAIYAVFNYIVTPANKEVDKLKEKKEKVAAILSDIEPLLKETEEKEAQKAEAQKKYDQIKFEEASKTATSEEFLVYIGKSAEENNVIQTHRVVKRYDVNNSVDETANPQINVKEFDYESGFYHDETGYNKKDLRNMSPGYLNPDHGSYIVKVTNPSGSVETYEYTSHTYDEGFRRKWTITLPLLDKHTIKESTSSSADSIVTEYTYGDNYAILSPTEVKVTETVDSESRTYYTKNAYDEDSCLPVMTTLPLTEGEKGNVPEYKKVYTEYENISDRYFVPETTKYYKDENGAQLSQTVSYDSMGRPVSQTDEAGNTVYTEYNDTYTWLPSRVYYKDPENIGDNERISEVQYLYEDTLLLGPTTTRTKYSDGEYAESHIEYDPKYGGVKEVTDEKGNATHYSYDRVGRLWATTSPSYASDTRQRQVWEEYSYSRLGEYNDTYYYRVKKDVYDGSYNRLKSTTDEYYDDYGNLVYRVTDAGEEEFIYDDKNRPIAYKNYDDFGTNKNTETCQYDNFDRIVSSTDSLGNTHKATYKLLSNEYSFTPSGSTTAENHSKEFYDIYGNVIRTEVYPGGINASPVTNTFTYDLAGNVLTSTDGNGNTTSFEYDVLGNNVKTVRADGSIIEREFNKWGTANKTVLTQDGNRYSANVDYSDDRGLATSIYSTGLEINTKPWYNEYDVDGKVMSVISPSGDKTTYAYDGLGNVTQKETGRRKDTFYYTFDGQVGGQSEYINGTLTETTVYNYDDLERLASKVIGEDTTSYTYNTLGSVMSVTSPTGLVTSYTRDDAERVTEVGFDNKEILYQYYGDGMVKKITYPNGMTTEYTYDNANRVTNIKTKKGSTVLRNYSYTYDGNGNVLSVSGSENVTYTYDALNRLTGSTKNGVTTTYTYDNRNNLVSETDGTNTKTYEYGGDNRLYKVTENGIETVYEYDLNGNLIKRGEDEFVYDESNRLVYSKVNGTETTYEIGIEGLRTSKTTDGVTTTYNLNESGYVLCENDEDIIYGHAALAKEINGKYYYYIYNAHGDVTALADENGNIVNTYEYDAWGKLTAETEAVANSIKYSGEYYDEETGLIYLRNRYYDPSARRFTSEDPARDDLNWYCYCGNNPVNYVDPWGLKATGEVIAWNSNSTLDVKIIQMRLNDLGYVGKNGKSLTVDGIFQENTLFAVKNFQKNCGLDVDGKVGDLTWKALGLMLDNDITERLHKETLRIIYENVVSLLPEGKGIPEKPDMYLYYLFYQMVRLNGPLDFKNQQGWESEYFIFDGSIVRYDAPGNIAYGFAGKILNLDELVLLAAAGWAQYSAGNGNEEWSFFESYGDDPIDQQNIRKGFKYFDKVMKK